mmetsp:Transcript_23179/g.33215  ORF Transcript_23179/g.33215 Transcript_23179/m.33215 type:complete len:89 (-) Transcript_23179:371-637(-)
MKGSYSSPSCIRNNNNSNITGGTATTNTQRTRHMTIHANHEICLIPQRSNYGRTIGCVNGRILEGATHVRPHTKRDDGDDGSGFITFD